ncbi:MAG: hypothetical protein JWQ89_3213 [Devosia sp.]|uniref:hypothetical protein n=1 Tax=Devosia sp. TaxID=1871048 RepID=UPI002627EA7B|nr:hypothetical protein [Devosia sp.]MDB5541486.1 hypothetical protein [Devosia sp.]
MKITASTLSRWSGLAAIVAGICYVLVGLFHPLNLLASVTTPTWAFVHVLACTMAFLGLLGLVGIYTRQVEETGWLGLIGFAMLSLWFALVLCFSFIETLLLPILATEAPRVVDGLMAMFTGPPGIDLGMLPTLWLISGPLYILGGLIFGIATFRAGVLPRWAGALLAVGTALAPVAALLPFEYQSKVTIPVGLALIWLGYALWSTPRAKKA